MKKGFFILTTLFLSQRVHAINLPEYLNFDGQLLNSSDQPITSTTSVDFEIYDHSGVCLLYKETQSITPDAYGEFSTKIGPDAGGTSSSNDGDIPWSTIFQNDSLVRTNDPTFCNLAGGYTPAAGQGRKLRVKVAGNTLTPDYTLAPVPYATVAQTLQGKVPNDFLPRAPTSGVAVLNADLEIQQNQRLKLGDSSSPSANFVNIKAPATFTSYTLTLPTTDGNANQFLQTDGNGILSWVTGSGGGLASINGDSTSGQNLAVSSAGLSPGWSTASGTHTLNIPMASTASVTAGLISNADYANFNSKLSGAGGTISGNLNISGQLNLGGQLNMGSQRISNLAAPSSASDAATKQYVDSLSPSALACATDEVLQYNGTAWVCGSVIGTAGNSVLTRSAFPSCSPGQTLVMSAGPTYSLSCATISVPAASISSTIPISQGGTGATSASAAFNALAPSQAGNSSKFLTTDGTNALWATVNSAIASDSLDFAHFADVLSLDASTDITVSGTNIFSVTNTGSAPSFMVNDIAGDTTPFVIDPNGNVGIGIANPLTHLDVNGVALLRPAGTATGQTGQIYLRELAANGSNNTILRSSDNVLTDVLLTLPSSAGSAGQYLVTDGSGVMSWSTPSHTNLGGLTNDDHPQYANLNGRASGQIFYGGNAPSDSLVIESTSDPTKGNILLHPTGTTGNIGIGTTSPIFKFEVLSGSTSVGAMKVKSNSVSQTVAIIEAIQTTAPALDVRVNNTSRMIVRDTGVGIGTTTPTVDLEVNITGLLRLKKQAAATAPAIGCTATTDGAVALANNYTLCVCKNGTGWVRTTDGTTACTW